MSEVPAQPMDYSLYVQLRRNYLDLHPVCEACGKEPAAIIHHKVTRQTHLNDVSVFMACCRPCERAFHRKPEQPKMPKGVTWLKRPASQMPVLKRERCNFKGLGPHPGCWGLVEFRHVYKGTEHVASWWLCARHRDQLLWGGQKLLAPISAVK